MEKNLSSSIINGIITLIIACVSCNVAAQNKDIDLLRRINAGRNNDLDGAMRSITNSVYPVAAIVPVAELVTGYRTHNRKLIHGGWQTIAGLGVNFGLTFGLKYAINRARPYVTYTFIVPDHYNKDPSFPSGHTSFAFNTATSLVIVFPKWYVAAPAYTWAVLTGYSRMRLGMHYPTDVLAGAAVGTGAAILAYKGNQWLHNKRSRAKDKH
ncbi:MAG: phosphatase PAP2 family protein [Taibaiella sp.]|nr:phosphatase PAP2 family protein [Taibaiella sp.]